MDNTPKSERKHLVFLGRRNAGKSSLMNAFAGQDIAIVSDIAGTTTDPVSKSMELLPFGPVVLVDTAGYDDDSELGTKRVAKTYKALSAADYVLLVVPADQSLHKEDKAFIHFLLKEKLPFMVVITKLDLISVADNVAAHLADSNIEGKELTDADYDTDDIIELTKMDGSDSAFQQNHLFHLKTEISMCGAVSKEVSIFQPESISELRTLIARSIPEEVEPPLINDLIRQGDIVVLVTPIDLGAPKGRLILPQVQTIRESLDSSAITIVVKDKELRAALDSLNRKPALIVCDSQAIMRVAADTPPDIRLTTFSILMARHKGDLSIFARSIKTIDTIENGDKILIAEACTHHAQSDDIGKIKIPRWIRSFTKKDVQFEFCQGQDFPENIKDYKLIVHCGSCMLTRKMMLSRLKQAAYAGVPIVNYGMIISYLHGAIPRAIEIFPETEI